MTSTLVTNIGELVTNDPSQAASAAGTTSPGNTANADSAQLLGLRREAALVVEDGLVAWIGDRADAPAADQRIDAGGAAVLPGFVDSHAHLVFEGDRSAEFAARMTGEPYDGGGIATTMRATREATDDELRAAIGRRMDEMRDQGTTCVEIKSGYGLDLEQEERALRLAREFTPETTYLGAHVVPPGTDRRAYLDLVTGDMLAACAPYARWVDVFCEPHSSHAFDGDETREVLEASVAAGLAPRLHAGQLGEGPGVQIGVEFDAASVDHCTYLTARDIEALAGSSTVATLLPGVEFSTRSPYPDARGLIDAGVTVALATDCNPGTCYSTSMPLMIALAVREMGMTPAEALWGATAGGAKALRRDDVGSLRVGMRADLAILDAPSYLHLCYRPGVPLARHLAVS